MGLWATRMKRLKEHLCRLGWVTLDIRSTFPLGRGSETGCAVVSKHFTRASGWQRSAWVPWPGIWSEIFAANSCQNELAVPDRARIVLVDWL
jgi:hypothetical protein